MSSSKSYAVNDLQQLQPVGGPCEARQQPSEVLCMVWCQAALKPPEVDSRWPLQDIAFHSNTLYIGLPAKVLARQSDCAHSSLLEGSVCVSSIAL